MDAYTEQRDALGAGHPSDGSDGLYLALPYYGALGTGNGEPDGIPV